MAKESAVTVISWSAPPKKPGRSGREDNFESRIESRAEEINERVTALAKSPIPSLWGDTDSSETRLEALLEQDARLRWLVRVARYSEGANRGVLWREAERVLVNLENFLAALSHAA